MKKSICTVLVLMLGSLSLFLTLGWFLNRNIVGDWFEETGFSVIQVITVVTLFLVVGAFVRAEPKRALAMVGLLLSAPGGLLCLRALIAIGGFIYYGDT